MRRTFPALLLLAACSSYEPAPWEPRDLLRELREIRVELPADGLDADQAAAIALIHHPGLAALRREHEIADNVVLAEGAWKNPEIRLGLQNLVAGAANPISLALGLRFFPAVPGESDALVARATARRKRVLAEIEDREARVAAETRIAHAKAALLDEKLKLVEAARLVHERLVTGVRQRVAAQAATRIDETLAFLKREDLERELLTLTGQRDVALAELAALLGIDPATPIRIRPSAAAASPLPSQDRLEEDALNGRSDLKALREEYEVREQSLRLAHLAHVFWPTFLQPGARVQSGDWGGAFSAGLEIPIFNSGSADIAVEESRRRQARDAYRARLHAVRLEIQLASIRLRDAGRRLRHATDRQGPLLRQSEELVKAVIDAGETDALKLISIETRLLDARRDEADFRFETERARIQLLLATGSIFLPR